MTPREIHSLMRRLCYFDISAVESYRHLMASNGLDRNLVVQLIDDYITTQDIIVYASFKECSHVQKTAAFELIQDYRFHDARARVQVVAADFSSRVVIEAIGTGFGENRNIVAESVWPEWQSARLQLGQT